ncbi:shikimate dehydrogenase [Lipingzhangella sp. LS1_29]|uniref:Shikimate dehydrogenase n=1 Tax=Lipingzhangella rawalii TaxID=2055835 RepID=A0ABU2H7U8_9ACTN|nr:shikimate dehydrogenase [Lipingzhangella rawalii]MDS1271375.1 shikimate dehydrogenase [Lipingzhangella rawalii]
MHAAVVGSPIAHSLSPVLHTAAYQELGLADTWTYRAVECSVTELPAFLSACAASPEPWAGLSVTMPLKRVALDQAERASELSRQVGGANTLVYRQGNWHADNTDVGGIVSALGEIGVRSVRSAVIVGAGATGAAALAALRALGATGDHAVRVVVRDPGRAQELERAAARMGATIDVRPMADLAACLDRDGAGVDVVVSTVPAGAADTLASTIAAANAAVLDVVYAPRPSVLAAAVTTAGGRVVDGFPMLLHQAALQVEQMTGCEQAPVEAMRAAGHAELRRRAAA